MVLDEHISGLIGRIYDGARDKAVWDLAMREIADRTDSRCMLVSTLDMHDMRHTSTSWHGPQDGRFWDGVREYEGEQYRLAPFNRYAMCHPDAGVVTLRTATEATGQDYATSEYCRWSEGAVGVGNGTLRYTMVRVGFGVALHPSAQRGDHSAEELALFGLLFGHIEKAMRLSVRPPDFVGGEGLNLLLDARGRVNAANEQARLLLARADGLVLSDGSISVCNGNEARRLDALLRSAGRARVSGESGGSMVVTRPSGRRGFVVTASPLPNPPGPFEALRPAILLSIVDPDTGETRQTDRWRAAFGLTPTEIRLARSLLDGSGNLRESADDIGMTYGTARVHLRNLFDKAGVRSQSQLALLLDRVARA